MNADKRVRPLRGLMKAWLAVHRVLSLRAWLLGKDPDYTPRWIRRNEGRFLNRSFLLDLYLGLWLCGEVMALWASGGPLRSRPVAAVVVFGAALLRLHELLGGVVYVMLKRSRAEYVDERKFAMTLLVYAEGLLVFAVLHSLLPVLLGYFTGVCPQSVYNFGALGWTPVSLLYYSTACYTTTGWGDISPVHPVSALLSIAETAVGVFLLAATIAGFISRAYAVRTKNA